MIPWWWSWLLVAWSCLGLWGVPRFPRASWTWLVWSIIPWNLYAVATDQMGFLAGNFVYGAVYLRNWWVVAHANRQIR